LKAFREKKEVWTPTSAGLKFRPVPDAPEPVQDKNQRLQQMRTMARSFRGELTDRRNEATGDPQSLRLLTQPIFRYDSRGKRLQDGALFAFVVGTDPETFLAVESREISGGTHRWEFALARMNRDAMQVFCADKLVWEVPAVNGLDNPKAEYLLIDLPKP
jgi:hypothetical protein